MEIYENTTGNAMTTVLPDDISVVDYDNIIAVSERADRMVAAHVQDGCVPAGARHPGQPI